MSRSPSVPNRGFSSVFSGSAPSSPSDSAQFKSKGPEEVSWGQFLRPSEVSDPWANSLGLNASVTSAAPVLASSSSRLAPNLPYSSSISNPAPVVEAKGEILPKSPQLAPSTAPKINSTIEVQKEHIIAPSIQQKTISANQAPYGFYPSGGPSVTSVAPVLASTPSRLASDSPYSSSISSPAPVVEAKEQISSKSPQIAQSSSPKLNEVQKEHIVESSKQGTKTVPAQSVYMAFPSVLDPRSPSNLSASPSSNASPSPSSLPSIATQAAQNNQKIDSKQPPLVLASSPSTGASSSSSPSQASIPLPSSISPATTSQKALKSAIEDLEIELPASRVVSSPPAKEKSLSASPIVSAEASKPSVEKPEWRFDITSVPISPVDNNRFLVFVGCKSMVEANVLKDLKEVNEALPAGQRGVATWQRGSFVLIFTQRKRAMKAYHSLQGKQMHNSTLNYHCEIHSPPHTALAAAYQRVGKSLPWVVSSPSSAKATAPVASYASMATSSSAPGTAAAVATVPYASQSPHAASPSKAAAAPSGWAKSASTASVSAQPVQQGKLPSFGGPSAPSAASTRSPNAAASVPTAASPKKKAVAPAPVVAVPAPSPTKQVLTRAQKNAPVYSPKSEPPAPETPTPKVPVVIGGITFEEITHSEWNTFYNAQNMLLPVKGEECNICMDEICRGQAIATLFCFCKFHQHCIDDWWDTKRSKRKPDDPRYPECPFHDEVIKNAVEQGLIDPGY